MEIIELIKKIEIEFELPENSLSSDTSFRDLKEWSSMHALILIALVDIEYNVTITGEDLRGMSTVSDLYNIIKGRLE